MSVRKPACGFCVSHVARLPAEKMGALRLKAVSRRGQIPGAGILHVSLPPRTSHDMIYHRRTREWFMVVSGRGRGVIGGRAVRFTPGVVVYMPPGVPHRMMTGKQPMEALVVFSPPLKLRGPGADLHLAPVARRARATRPGSSQLEGGKLRR